MRASTLRRAAAAAVILGLGWTSAPARAVDHPDRFVLTSPDLKDNAMLKAAHAAPGMSLRGDWDCGGQDVSPALAWARPPGNTKSYAVMMIDPDARSGLGDGAHWLVYDIPASAKGLPRGAGAHPERYVGGSNSRKLPIYSGPCAEPGAKAHHFLFQVFALDLPPGTLKPGLDRAAFMQAIQGHVASEGSLVARYERPAKEKVAAKKAVAQR